MKEKFTASNGVDITVTAELDETYLLGKGGVIEGGDRRWTVCTGNSEGMDALREYFQYERDQGLGRWRSKRNPDWTAKVAFGRAEFRHDDGQQAFNVVLDGDYNYPWSGNEKQVLGEFLESESWNYAELGEIWVITDDFGRVEPYVRASKGWRRVSRKNVFLSRPIMGGRRLWPEVCDAS